MNKTDFIDLWTPRYPYAANTKTDQKRMSRAEAIQKRFIETTPTKARNLIVLDVDNDHSEWHIKSLIEEDEVIPEPNYITYNPDTGNAQLGFFLQGSVGSKLGINFYNDTFESLKKRTGTDEAYTGRLMRNPTSPFQRTEWRSNRLFTLAELNPPKKNEKGSIVVSGDPNAPSRNRDTFDSLRAFAYTEFSKCSSIEELRKKVEVQADILNAELALDNPKQGSLSESELRVIVRSIIRFVDRKFDKEAFSKQQAFRANIRWENNKEVYSLRQAQNQNILFMLEAGFTVREIASALSLSYEAAKSACRRVKASSRL